MPEITLSLPTAVASHALGHHLAALVTAGDVLTLSGPMGAGKTTLAQGLIAGLTGQTDASSPTYTLVHRYGHANGPIWHFDLYRLNHPEEALEAGLEDALSGGTDDGGLVLIEWPERAGDLIPEDSIAITLSAPTDTPRHVHINAPAHWIDSLKTWTAPA